VLLRTSRAVKGWAAPDSAGLGEEITLHVSPQSSMATRVESDARRRAPAGVAHQEIAQRLFLAVPTVKTHVHRILTKTGQRGRLAAALLYRQRAAAGPGSGPAGAGAGTGGTPAGSG